MTEKYHANVPSQFPKLLTHTRISCWKQKW